MPLRHDSGGNIDAPEEEVWRVMRPMLTKLRIIAHNAKFELANVRKAAGYELASDGGSLTCTMLGAFNTGIAELNYRTLVDLKGLVLKLFGHQMTHIDELWPNSAKNKKASLRFNTLDVEPKVVSYACEDAAWVLPLDELVTTLAYKERGFIQNLEHHILKIVEDMERKGTSVDWAGIEEAQSQADTFVPAMEAYVKDELGKLVGRDLSELNLNSPPQLKKLLFQEIGMSTTRLTKKGAEAGEGMEDWQKMSSDKKSLVALAEEYEAVDALLKFREVKNLANRVSKWLKEYQGSIDGKVHANYKQAASESNDDNSATAPGSGRFSSSDPAIQQLPKKWFWSSLKLDFDAGEKKNKSLLETFTTNHTNGVEYWKGNFRNYIVASPGCYFLGYDYSQVELRMLAGASQEPALLEAFLKDDDVHTMTAALMLGKDPFDINEDTERPIGKTFNFALMYGMGPKSLGEQLGLDIERAKELYQEYFKVFSNVSTWMNASRYIGLEHGYAETIFGRKIPVWQLNHPLRGVQAQGARVLVNGPIQGSAADYMKIAMLRAYSTLKKEGLWFDKVTIVANLHDALTFEVDNSVDPNELRELLASRVVFGEEVSPILKGYPYFKADWELGQRWGDSTKWSLNTRAAFVDGLWRVQDEPQVSDFTLVLSENPTEKSYRDFISSVKKTTGNTKISLTLPAGTVELPFTAGVTKTSANELRKIFRNASMRVL